MTIPDLNKYSVYLIKMSAVAHTILCTRINSVLRGGGGLLYEDSTTAYNVYGITISLNGKTLTYGVAGFFNGKTGKITKCAITAIYGLI